MKELLLMFARRLTPCCAYDITNTLQPPLLSTKKQRKQHNQPHRQDERDK